MILSMKTNPLGKAYSSLHRRNDTEMCKNPVEDIRQAKACLVAIFGDLETYKEFVMRRQEKRFEARCGICRFLYIS